MVIGFGAIVLAGACYELLARRNARHAHPARGTLVDIGGRRIHLDCRGTGSPTVVFESGLDINGSLSWITVHDSIAAGTRACAYDRASIMWSDQKDGRQNGTTIAEDLRATLAAAREVGPFVLVGHSLGGPYVVTFTKQYGELVAGLVFVDPSHPEQRVRFAATIAAPIRPPYTVLKVAQLITWTGLLRIAVASGGFPAIPEPVRKEVSVYAGRSLSGIVAETESFDETLAEASTFRTLGDRPLVVLTAMAPLSGADLASLKLTKEDGPRFRAIWQQLHEDQLTWSTRSRQQLAADAGHYIQFDRPDVVIAAVREVVARVRQGGPR